MRKCCTGDCRQGRDCPFPPLLSQAEIDAEAIMRGMLKFAAWAAIMGGVLFAGYHIGRAIMWGILG
jgi:hypothetical protein